jgi:UDP-glucose 4-epimerase
MDVRSVFGVSSSSFSVSRASSTSDFVAAPDSIGTPATNQSTLFDDVVVPPLDISRDEETYILVVGGLGYIGSHTTLELLKAGYGVVVVDDLSNAFRDVLDRVERLASEYCRENRKARPVLKFHEADYKSPVMRSIIASYMTPAHLTPDGQQRSRIKGVIHFAAFKSVEESINQPIPYYLNNVCGMVNFLALLQEFGIQNFVFSSSATVYGSRADRGTPLREELCVHEREAYMDESGAQQASEQGVSGLTSPYGRTKWMCEAILADVAKSDPSWSITALRYFNPVGCHESGLLGEHPRQVATNLFPVVFRVLTGKQERLEIFGTDWDTEDGTTIRDYIHVSDLAKGHIAALDASAKGKIRQPFRTFNLGTGRGHTVRKVVKSIEKASSQTLSAVEAGRRKGDVGACVADVQRASAELGWKTEKSLDDCSVDAWNFIVKSKQASPPAKNPKQIKSPRKNPRPFLA